MTPIQIGTRRHRPVRTIRGPEDESEWHRRAYPDNVELEFVDDGVSAVFRTFPRDSWREASLREIVGVILSDHYHEEG